jgi:DNA polymerase-1
MPGQTEKGCVGRGEVVSDGCVGRSPFVLKAWGAGACTDPETRYVLVRDEANLFSVQAALDNTDLVGLDVETTGLDPRTDRVRLLTLNCDTIDGGRFSYLIDCFAVDPSPLWEALAEKDLAIHNAAFDLAFLERLGFTPAGKVHDTLTLARLLAAGTQDGCSLEECCARYLNVAVDKTHQQADWAGELTPAMIAYAANDADLHQRLYRVLVQKIDEAGMAEVAEIERRALPAITWLARSGAPFDLGAWQALAEAALAEREQLRQSLDQAAPARPGFLSREGAWDWNSPAQVKEALHLAGCEVESTADEALAALDHPLAELLRRYRSACKRADTYGRDWLKHVASDGRVHPSWNQTGARTGRMSCSDPNLQNLPRDPAYRRCFKAPEGRVLLKADYGQLELRLAAVIAGEQQMIEAFQRGEDLHALTARHLFGKTEVTKQERQLGKPTNFGLIYGSSARGLRSKAQADYGLTMTEAEARQFRNAFFKAYPAIRRWHKQLERDRLTETRTKCCRRVLVEPDFFFGARANYVIQGTAGDGFKIALALLWERRDQAPGAFPVLAIHDELVVECDADRAAATASWLKAAMVDAMHPLLDPVPVEVEVKVARTWAGD